MPIISEECKKCLSYKNGDCFGESRACSDYKYSPQMTEAEKEAWPYVMGSSRFSTHFEWKKEFEKRARHAEENLASQAKKNTQIITLNVEDAVGIPNDNNYQENSKTKEPNVYGIEPSIIIRDEDVKLFFGQKNNLAYVYFALYNYMHKKDPEIIARFNGDVLGLSLARRKYLLYFVHEDKEVFIKFRTKSSKETALVSNMQEYYSECDRILESDYRLESEMATFNSKRLLTREELDRRVAELKNLIQKLPGKVQEDEIITRNSLYVAITRRFDIYGIQRYEDLIRINATALCGLATLTEKCYGGLVRFLQDPRKNDCKYFGVNSNNKNNVQAENSLAEEISRYSEEKLKEDFWNEVKYLFAESERLNTMYDIGANSQLCEYAVKTLEYVVRRSTETIPSKEYTYEEYEEELNSIIHKAHREKTARELKELIMAIPIEQYYPVILYAGKAHSYLFNALVEISSD